jgi:hypothetical protein
MPQHKEWPEHKGGFGSIGARLVKDESLVKLQEMRKQLPKARKVKKNNLEEQHQEIVGGLIDLWKLCEQNYNALPRAVQVATRDLKAQIAKVTGG